MLSSVCRNLDMTVKSSSSEPLTSTCRREKLNFGARAIFLPRIAAIFLHAEKRRRRTKNEEIYEKTSVPDMNFSAAIFEYLINKCSSLVRV